MIIFRQFRSETRRHLFQERVGEFAGGKGVKNALSRIRRRLNDAGRFLLLQVRHEIPQRAFGVDGRILDDDVGVGHREKNGVATGSRRIHLSRHVVEFVLVET